MKKEELVNIISSRLSSQAKETAVAFEIFLQKVAESLELNESVKIPDVGIFQLKRKGGADESGSQAKSSFYLLFVPLKYNRRDKNEALAFQVNPRNIKKTEIDDDVFSLSVDKPVIPVTEQAKKDFLVHSSYLMMQKNFEDRVDGLLLNSVNLSDFEIDYNFSSIPEENKFDIAPAPEAETEDNESIPWDFGEEESSAEGENIIETADENPEDDFDSIVAKITGDFTDETPAFDDAETGMPDDILNVSTEIPEEDDLDSNQQSETEEVLNEIMPGDDSNDTDNLFEDLLGENELSVEEEPLQESETSQEDEISGSDEPFKGELPENESRETLSEFQGSGELGEDWFTLKEIDDEEEEAEEEKAFQEEIPAEEEPEIIDDQVDNIDDKLELLTDMEAGLEIDPFEDFPLAEENEQSEEEEITEEILEEEPVMEEPAEEEPAVKETDSGLDVEELNPVSFSAEKMLEDEDEEEHKVKYPGTFWMILGALVLVTLGGIYYFFFMNKGTLTMPDFAGKGTTTSQPSEKPQIIERDYSVPVTVYKRSTENPQEVQTDGSETQNAEGQNNNEPQNTAPQNNTVQNNNAAKTETPGMENKQQVTKTPVTKTPEQKTPETNTQANKPVTKNNTVVKNNPGVNNTPVVKQNQGTVEVQVQPRSDTKDKLIKQDIFTDGRGRYTIQESSWQSMAEAVKRVKYFRSQGLDAYYTKYAPKGAKVWYRVRIGDFPSLEETEKTLKKVR